ncbi:putative ankyrin repeat-containing domain-containing protein [Helianthus annuus]|nr:putative ankyrin repeat-containing domain-containing protein [Helianthus annuus]KAJ0930143.1 putative ankyrin repeat-containing domain-containing protein [Helianthus annuus]
MRTETEEEEEEERKRKETEEGNIKKEEERKRKEAEEEERKRQEVEEEIKKKNKKKARAMESLYAATLNQDISSIKKILDWNKDVVTLRDKIAINGNTALHVAVGTTKNKEFLKKMLKMDMQNSDTMLKLDMKNSDGSTLLHVAAIVGNTEAAELLVETDRELLYTTDKEDQTPLARALSNMHTNTYTYLLHEFNNVSDQDIEAGNGSSWGLLVNIISSKDYGLAESFFGDNQHMPLTDVHIVLTAIAQNFPSKLNSWERMFAESTCSFTCFGYQFTALRQFKFVKAIKRKQNAFYRAKRLLHDICVFIKSKIDSGSHHEYYNNAILEATRQNADEVVKIVVSVFPDAIWSTNAERHNIIQYAVITRSEKVYNLLYQMSEHKNIYKTIQDPLGNNLLHLAARLAPPEKLTHISGAALQIQHELQWFKEVQGFVCPLNIIQKNSKGETPQMVFTREHKELVIEGEKWMKETAQSYTITAALITTIVFAAAITVRREQTRGGQTRQWDTRVY